MDKINIGALLLCAVILIAILSVNSYLITSVIDQEISKVVFRVS